MNKNLLNIFYSMKLPKSKQSLIMPIVNGVDLYNKHKNKISSIEKPTKDVFSISNIISKNLSLDESVINIKCDLKNIDAMKTLIFEQINSLHTWLECCDETSPDDWNDLQKCNYRYSFIFKYICFQMFKKNQLITDFSIFSYIDCLLKMNCTQDDISIKSDDQNYYKFIYNISKNKKLPDISASIYPCIALNPMIYAISVIYDVILLNNAVNKGEKVFDLTKLLIKTKRQFDVITEYQGPIISNLIKKNNLAVHKLKQDTATNLIMEAVRQEVIEVSRFVDINKVKNANNIKETDKDKEVVMNINSTHAIMVIKESYKNIQKNLGALLGIVSHILKNNPDISHQNLTEKVFITLLDKNKMFEYNVRSNPRSEKRELYKTLEIKSPFFT